MQAFKCHFKGTLATFDPEFSLVNWDKLLEQSLSTLNLLHDYCLNPVLTTRDFLCGKFDFDKNPLALPSTKDPNQNNEHHGSLMENVGFSLHFQCNFIDERAI